MREGKLGNSMQIRNIIFKKSIIFISFYFRLPNLQSQDRMILKSLGANAIFKNVTGIIFSKWNESGSASRQQNLISFNIRGNFH